jgi:hypothetical protein
MVAAVGVPVLEVLQVVPHQPQSMPADVGFVQRPDRSGGLDARGVEGLAIVVDV